MNPFLQSIPHYSIPDLTESWHDIGSVLLVHTKLAPDELVFTDKMIQAFDWPGLQFSHLIYLPENKVNYQLLWSQKQIRMVILFGISPGEMGLNIQVKPYHLVYIEPFYLYQTDAVGLVAGHKDNKSKIWKDLRGLQLIR